jgi:hypothetical protein
MPRDIKQKQEEVAEQRERRQVRATAEPDFELGVRVCRHYHNPLMLTGKAGSCREEQTKANCPHWIFLSIR